MSNISTNTSENCWLCDPITWIILAVLCFTTGGFLFHIVAGFAVLGLGASYGAYLAILNQEDEPTAPAKEDDDE